jgi:protein involved in polysaccharide export with SLBB domain
MEIIKRWVVLTALLIMAGSAVQAQELFYKKNLANIKVDQLTDEQVLRFRQQIETSNMSEKDLIRYFSGKGLSPQEIKKLKARLGGFNSGSTTRDGKGSDVYETDLARAYYNLLDSLNMFNEDDLLGGKFARRKVFPDSVVFGSELFATAKLGFTPDLKLAAPAGYILGPGDELNVVIFGAHEASFDLVVTPEGRINVPFGGVVVVNGLSIEQASRKVSQLLQKNGISSLASGESQLLISVTDFRTIPVTVIGARVPGTYLMPAVANVFHALYAAGGPATHGTYREIEVIRKGKVIKTIDLYKFLTRGDDTDFIHVKENDVINIPVYANRIAVKGEVKRPGLFELTSGESLESLMKYAGGFSELAFKESIQLIEIIDNERVAKRVALQDFGSYVPGSGAALEVLGVVNTVRSRVVASGAFMRPGSYAWENGMTLSALFEQAKGVEKYALMNRGFVYRKAAASDAAYLRFSIEAVLEGRSDLNLEDGDSVVVADRLSLLSEQEVLVLGKVQFEGPVLFVQGMSAKDAVLLAGGFTQDALKDKIEISRRSIDAAGKRSAVSVFENSDSSLSVTTAEIPLMPGDVIIVREDPNYKSQRMVVLNGEILYPGPYSLLSKGEKLSTMLKRAGGLTEYADPSACYIVRTTKNPFYNKILEQKQSEEARYKLRSNNLDELEKASGNARSATNKSSSDSRLPDGQSDISLMFENPDSLLRDTISIDLSVLMGNRSNSKYDLILRDGDEIHVLERRNTVAIRGEVNSKVIVNHQSRRLKSYIKDAGGFSKNADMKRVFVIEANGRSRMTTSFLGIKKYPRINPGVEVVVPAKVYDERTSDPARMAAVASILASTTSVLFLVITLTR